MTFSSRIKIEPNGKILHWNKEDHQTVECPICNQEIKPYWELRYNGIRATCNECGINWPES